MRRQHIIEALMVDSVVRILDRNQLVWLSQILEHGFVGFDNMSDEQLCDELIERGLSFVEIEPLVDDNDYVDDDDELLQSRLASNLRDARAFEAG